jgi:hypothetical protein
MKAGLIRHGVWEARRWAVTLSSLAVRLAPPAARASFGRTRALAGPAFVVSLGYADPRQLGDGPRGGTVRLRARCTF